MNKKNTLNLKNLHKQVLSLKSESKDLLASSAKIFKDNIEASRKINLTLENIIQKTKHEANLNSNKKQKLEDTNQEKEKSKGLVPNSRTDQINSPTKIIKESIKTPEIKMVNKQKDSSPENFNENLETSAKKSQNEPEQKIQLQPFNKNTAYKSKKYKYIYNNELDLFENQVVEFKLFKSLHVQLICNYVCGFLNMSGGSLYIGVSDKGFVKGISLNRSQIDNFQIELDRTLRNFSPPVFPNQITISFEKLFDNYNNTYYKVDRYRCRYNSKLYKGHLLSTLLI